MKVKVPTLALHRSLAVVTFRFFLCVAVAFNEPSGHAKVIKNRKQNETIRGPSKLVLSLSMSRHRDRRRPSTFRPAHPCGALFLPPGN